MKFRKWLPVLLIILGTVPFLAALILGLPVFRVTYLTYGEFLILWSYLFWPTYIFGVLLMLTGVYAAADVVPSADVAPKDMVFTDYGYPEWWWGYPGYWDVPYWGNWGGGWYYPYAVSYTYSTGSFLTELLNLEAPQGQKEKLPILWTAYMSGMLSGSTEVNVELAAQAVAQAFSQSTYLTNK